MMIDDRDHRPPPAPADWDNTKSASLSSRDGCAFWAAAGAGGMFLLLAGYGLAALVDAASAALLAVLT